MLRIKKRYLTRELEFELAGLIFSILKDNPDYKTRAIRVNKLLLDMGIDLNQTKYQSKF